MKTQKTLQKISRFSCFALISLLAACGGSSSDKPAVNDEPPANGSPITEGESIRLVDENATAETASLALYLKQQMGKGILFGHQHETTQGMTVSDKNSGLESDTKTAVGDFAAVYGWDTLSIVDGHTGVSEEPITEGIKQAYARGGIITISTHFDNLSYEKTGGGAGPGTSWDTRVSIPHILPGGKDNQAYIEMLDQLADFANNMKDDNGKLIPIIFRIYHEHTGAWFWWGSSSSTPEQYKMLFRYTVEYLRDTKNVHNFLYAFSPSNVGFNTEEDFLERYPGDGYVDVIGFDQYFNESGMDDFVSRAELLVNIAEERDKSAIVAEGGWIVGSQSTDWYTVLLDKLKANEQARKIAYLLVWRNCDSEFCQFGSGPQYWVPFVKEGANGSSQETVDDFKQFYQDDFTLFNEDIAELPVYSQETNVTSAQGNVEKEIILLNPVNYDTVSGEFDISILARGYTGDISVSLTSPLLDEPVALTALGNYFYRTTLDATGWPEDEIANIEIQVESTETTSYTLQLVVDNVENAVTANIVDNFDGYYGIDGILSRSWLKVGGDQSSVSLGEDGNSLNITYSLGSSGYAGHKRSTLGNTDWTEFNQLTLDIDAEQTNQLLVIQVHSQGTDWEAFRILGDKDVTYTDAIGPRGNWQHGYTGNNVTDFSGFIPKLTGPESLTINFSEFIPKNLGISRLKPESIESMAFYINSIEPFERQGMTLTVDNILLSHVNDGGDFSLDPTYSSSGTPFEYNFESSVESWAVEIDWSTSEEAELSDAWSTKGNQSLLGTADLTTVVESYSLKLAQDLDVNGLDTISVNVFVENAGAETTARLFVQEDNDAWTWYDSGFEVVGEGITLTLDVSEISAVKTLGINFSTFDDTQTEARFYIDELVAE